MWLRKFKVVSVCYLDVLQSIIKQNNLDHDGLNVATSTNSTMWVGTTLTPELIHEFV